MSEQKILSTVDEVIDALGGTLATAKLFGIPMQAVSNWRANGKLPARRYLKFQRILNERQITAPPAIWDMEDA